MFKISWDIFADVRADLDELLWQGSLAWEFLRPPLVDIGPLSLFEGDFLDLFHTDESKPDLVRLAQTVSQAEWMELTRSFLLGRGILYRGLRVCNYHPVVLLEGTPCQVLLRAKQPVPLEGRVRLRVNLAGSFKQTVAVR